MFLEQYWGGPTDLLRAARAPPAADAARAVPIGPVERDAWLRHMGERGRRAGARARAARPMLWDYLGARRAVMVNSFGLSRPWSTTDPTDPGWLRTVVARRRRLPGLHPLVRRQRRRRGRRPARHPLAAAATSASSASTPSGSRRSIPRRWPTVGTTSPTTATSTRCSAPWPTSTRLVARRPRAWASASSSTSCPTTRSDQHAWFQEALAAGPGSPARARLHLPRRRGPRRPGARPTTGGRSSAAPPGPGRRAGRPGEWYLHLFTPEQPDFNWSNPEVARSSSSILRFWLDRGVDGFRIDVAHGLAKDQTASARRPRAAKRQRGTTRPRAAVTTTRCGTSDGVHEIYRRLAPDARLPTPATAWRSARYGSARPSGAGPLPAPRRAAPGVQLPLAVAPSGTRWLLHESVESGAVDRGRRRRRRATWVLSNHDVVP